MGQLVQMIKEFWPIVVIVAGGIAGLAAFYLNLLRIRELRDKLRPTDREKSDIGSIDVFQVAFLPGRHIPSMIFLPIFAFFLAWGAVDNARKVIIPKVLPPDLLQIIGLPCCTVGCGFTLLTFLWMLFGKERIFFRPDALLIRHELFGIARVRHFYLWSVSNLRVSPEDNMSARKHLWGRRMIAFDYGLKIIRFGPSIDKVEAQNVVAQMRTHHLFPDSPQVV